MKARLLAAVALLAASAATVASTSGCGPQRRGAPHTRELGTADPTVARGEQAFAQHCHHCHPGGAGGLGPAINDKPLPVTLIKTQVRQGLGAMPAFGPEEVSDADVQAIAEYLKGLRSL
jgi:mono/diheme cytochrome c family protein